MNTAFNEYKTTSHFNNPAGVKAICSDCHVPKGWGHKIVKKIRATAELYHFVVGTIDTPEKYEAKRLALARSVWRNMAETDSRGCRNCHAFEDMQINAQSSKAIAAHNKAIDAKHTCIDCHKGIAHHYPDPKRHLETAWQAVTTAADDKSIATADRVFPISTKQLFADPDATEKAIAVALAATDLAVVERKPGWLKVTVSGWIKDQNRKIIYAVEGKDIVVASLGRKATDLVREAVAAQPPFEGMVIKASAQTGMAGMTGAEAEATSQAEGGEGVWSKVSFTAWTEDKDIVDDRKRIWTYAAEFNELICGKCHVPYAPKAFEANAWPGHLKDMKRYADLEKESARLLAAYLQYNAKDIGGH